MQCQLIHVKRFYSHWYKAPSKSELQSPCVKTFESPHVGKSFHRHLATLGTVLCTHPPCLHAWSNNGKSEDCRYSLRWRDSDQFPKTKVQCPPVACSYTPFPTCSNWVTGSLVFLKLSSLLVSRSVQSTIGNYTRNLQPAAARSHRYTCRDDLKIGPCQKRTEKPMQKLLPHRVEKLATGGKPAARKRVPQETLKREATGRPALRAVAHIACQTTGLYYSIRS